MKARRADATAPVRINTQISQKLIASHVSPCPMLLLALLIRYWRVIVPDERVKAIVIRHNATAVELVRFIADTGSFSWGLS